MIKNRKNIFINSVFLSILLAITFTLISADATPEVNSTTSPEMPSTATPSGPIIEKMVEIKGGWFKVGSKKGYKDELPEHLVYVDTFYMDENEVTNAAYKEYCDNYGHTYPVAADSQQDYFEKYLDHPVVNVSWDDAEGYCSAKNKRLPTEAEWIYAALGDNPANEYSFGVSWDPSLGNFLSSGDKQVKDSKDNSEKATESSVIKTKPIKSYKANSYNIYDLTGNVAEWVMDWYDEKYYIYSKDINPTGPKSGEFKVIKGGSFLDNNVTSRTYYRAYGYPFGKYYINVGFRCVAEKRNIVFDETINAFRTNPKEVIIKPKNVEPTLDNTEASVKKDSNN